MRVAIFNEPGSTPTLQEVEHSPLQGNEVLVRIAGVGICHTDLSGLNGNVPLPTPAIRTRTSLTCNGECSTSCRVGVLPGSLKIATRIAQPSTAGTTRS